MTFSLRGGLHDERGAIAIWAALLAPVMLALGALSVDIARIYNLDADLQAAADAMARAGAIELDGHTDAIERATRAVGNLPVNRQRLADGGAGAVASQSLRFLTDLPLDDATAITDDYVTTDPTLARFVEVQVQPKAITTIFPTGVAMSLVKTTLNASAVGGRQAQICGAAPLFICDPLEGQAGGLVAALEDRSFRGRLIQLRSKGGESAYFPGNFGFLEAPGGRSASELRDMMGQVSPETCFDSRGVILRTGQISSVSHGLNTRFDLYDGPFNSKKNDPAYAPAQNVTKGYTGQQCSPSPDPDAAGLPRDNCFASGTCPGLSGRMGDGVWNIARYMQVNHGAPASATIAGVTYTFNYGALTVSPATPPTRYEVYRWEIDNSRIPGQPAYGASKTPEVGTPRCASAASSTVSDRRIIPVAVLACNALEAQGRMGGRNTVPASGFVKVFLTEPMGSGQDDIIWGELIGMMTKGIDAQARDDVQVRR